MRDRSVWCICVCVKVFWMSDGERVRYSPSSSRFSPSLLLDVRQEERSLVICSWFAVSVPLCSLLSLLRHSLNSLSSLSMLQSVGHQQDLDRLLQILSLSPLCLSVCEGEYRSSCSKSCERSSASLWMRVYVCFSTSIIPPFSQFSFQLKSRVTHITSTSFSSVCLSVSHLSASLIFSPFTQWLHSSWSSVYRRCVWKMNRREILLP